MGDCPQRSSQRFFRIFNGDFLCLSHEILSLEEKFLACDTFFHAGAFVKTRFGDASFHPASFGLLASEPVSGEGIKIMEEYFV